MSFNSTHRGITKKQRQHVFQTNTQKLVANSYKSMLKRHIFPDKHKQENK